MEQAAPVLSVSRLNGLIKDLVEENFMQVLVEGEVSNLSRPSSGHLYFSLKDSQAQIRAVMFRMHARALGFEPENGMKLLCRGHVSLYPQRGEVQLVLQSLEPLGTGSLQVAFEQLKTRLQAEGLFDAQRKSPLPPFPTTIGVVTSATGAAIHDILNVLGRRGAGLRVILRPVRVQGADAAAEIAQGIADLNRQGLCDVLLVGRGGGSLEDLWAFNEEEVARAIAASRIPVVSAVGHEVDVTIADYVADLRAPTPSAAAELVVKNRLELETHVDQLILRLQRQMRSKVVLLEERVEGLNRRLLGRRQLFEGAQRRQAELKRRLEQAMKVRLKETEGALASLASRLEVLSPLRTLARGYAVVVDATSQTLVTDAGRLNPGQNLELRLARGRALAQVSEVLET